MAVDIAITDNRRSVQQGFFNWLQEKLLP